MTNKPLTKAQVVKQFAERLDLPKNMSKFILEELASFAVEQTVTNGAFNLPGFGKFVRAERKERMGRNPKTGEPIKIPAKTVVRMRLSKTFKDAVMK